MAQTIKLKRSATPSAIPSTSSLSLGEVAINTYDGKMYIKKNDGSDSVVEIGGSSGAAATGIWKEYLYTATANQTAFTGADDNGVSLTFTAGQIQVFFNGVLLEPTTDYTTASNTVTLVSGAAVGDIIQVASASVVLGTGDILTDVFTGDGSTVAFTLSTAPGVESNTLIFIDGVYQSKTGYSISSTTLTFSGAPANGAEIEASIGSREVSYPDTTAINLSGDLSAVNGSYSGTLTVGSLDIASTGALQSPVGTTAQRPTPAAGYFRYNSTTGKFEGYSTQWSELGATSTVEALEDEVILNLGVI